MLMLSDSMLQQAESLLQQSSDLDTAVRDTVADGLARIVFSAYDTRAVAECVSDFDSGPYIQAKTYEWFRERGFVEWFCAGASVLFRTTPRLFYRIRVKAKPKQHVTVLAKEKVG